MKCAAYFLLFCLGLCVRSAHADAASKERKVREMLVALRLEETTNRLEQAQEERIRATSEQQLATASPDPDQKKHYEEFRSRVIDLLRRSASWKALEPDFVRLYSDAYSEEELNGILVFYRSPTGRTMLARNLELTDKCIAISQRRMAELAPKIQELVDQFERELH